MRAINSTEAYIFDILSTAKPDNPNNGGYAIALGLLAIASVLDIQLNRFNLIFSSKTMG